MTSPAKLLQVVAVLAACLGAPAAGRAAAPVLFEERTVLRVDGSELTLLVSRPETGAWPALIYMAGSLCLPSEIETGWLKEAVERRGDFALLVVEKPGVEPIEANSEGEIRFGPEAACSPEFAQYYDRNQRIIDHLRAVQTLRADAPWWNGEILLWGFSDGGSFGAEIAAYLPEVQRVVLGGFGGGMTFREFFTDHAMCTDAAERAACVAELEDRFAAMQTNPRSDETWLGAPNAWRVWASRLDALPATVLADTDFPLVVYHGAEDAAVPVKSARRLAETMREARPQDFFFIEAPAMGHGRSGLESAQLAAFRNGMLAWLLSGQGDPAAGLVASQRDVR